MGLGWTLLDGMFKDKSGGLREDKIEDHAGQN